jgi:hypothetical protein
MLNGPTARPKATDIAVKILYLALAASALRSVFLEWSVLQTSHPAANTFFSILFLGITLWLILMIGRGRNWARGAYLAWYVISLPVFGLEVYHLLERPLTGSLGILNTLLGLAALALLYREESAAWFRAGRGAGQ